LELVTLSYIAVFIPGTEIVFDVSLAAIDLCGTGNLVKPVTTTCTTPTASFSWEADSLQVTLTDQSSGTQPLAYLCNFGDATTSTEQSPNSFVYFFFSK